MSSSKKPVLKATGMLFQHLFHGKTLSISHFRQEIEVFIGLREMYTNIFVKGWDLVFIGKNCERFPIRGIDFETESQ